MRNYRLGFLLCDHALGHLAERFGDYPAMFAQAFAEVSKHIDWHVFDVTQGELPGNWDTCDGYLISGSRHGTYDGLPWMLPLENFIRAIATTRQPLVGLCFGHQIIAQALGAKVRKAAQGWGIGLRRYEVHVHEAWMQPASDEFVVPVCHQDQVLTLPADAVRIASSAHCENFIVRFRANILGIQGHPEFAPAFVDELIEWRRASLPLATYTAARESLHWQHDNRQLKHWITRFLAIPN